jgi:hypothetical protein
MRLDDYLSDPTEQNNQHPVYQNSLLSPAAAEYATGEVILGSVYRRLILGVSEAAIDLKMIPTLPDRFQGSLGGETLWSQILQEGVVGSPPTKKSKYRQLMPLVPEMARHAGVLGVQRSRWNPSNLFLEAIGAGAGKDKVEELVKKLGNALEVDSTDDIFAQYLENSFRKKVRNIESCRKAL